MSVLIVVDTPSCGCEGPYDAAHLTEALTGCDKAQSF